MAGHTERDMESKESRGEKRAITNKWGYREQRGRMGESTNLGTEKESEGGVCLAEHCTIYCLPNW